jgi:hypothetical protein
VQIRREDESERYLGRKLTFKDHNEVELANRTAAAWAAFHKHKEEPCNRHYRIEDRVRLFEAVVTPTALYGCAAWALTSKMSDNLKTARRKMLRYVFHLHRRRAGPHAETWVEYMRRSARQVDELTLKYGIEEWTTMHRRRKWAFAGQTARQTDSRWSTLSLEWKPHEGHGRSRGRPRTRWSDDLEKYAGGSWPDEALDSELWKALEEGYVRRM